MFVSDFEIPPRSCEGTSPSYGALSRSPGLRVSSCERSWRRQEASRLTQHITWKRRSSYWKRSGTTFFKKVELILCFSKAVFPQFSNIFLIKLVNLNHFFFYTSCDVQVERLKVRLQEADQARGKLLERAKRHVSSTFGLFSSFIIFYKRMWKSALSDLGCFYSTAPHSKSSIKLTSKKARTSFRYWTAWSIKSERWEIRPFSF